jgi:glycosyltransferase involved in cell wall biosynthesis
MLYANVPWKGVDISLKAVEIAQQTIPNLQLLTFGSHPLSDTYPLPANSHYTKSPNQSVIREIYSSCDAWLFASRSEGFGLPILEAMACRTPVIGVPTGAAPEFLADGAGILVKPEDPEDMARAIVSICQLANEDWRTLSDTAYQRVTGYTWDNATDLFEAALVRAIEQNSNHHGQQTSRRKT